MESFSVFSAIMVCPKTFFRKLFLLNTKKGAGKSTTINILTGLYPPSGGGASINGFDLESQLDEIRKIASICPQHDVIFIELCKNFVTYPLVIDSLGRACELFKRKKVYTFSFSKLFSKESKRTLKTLLHSQRN